MCRTHVFIVYKLKIRYGLSEQILEQPLRQRESVWQWLSGESLASLAWYTLLKSNVKNEV
jgi:hypothetical protein